MTKRPFAKAALIKDGVFAYIGGADEAKKLADTSAQVLDYGDNFIYPGFLESHCHGYFAGYRAIGQANLSQFFSTDYSKYREVIKKFIADNPNRELYIAQGWIENDEYVTKAYLDEICSDKPLIMNTGSDHSMSLNTKALEGAGIDAEYTKKYGYDIAHVDKNGFTPVVDAGVELNSPLTIKAYYELEQEGKLKMRTYAYLVIPQNLESPKAEVSRAAADHTNYIEEYFHVVGLKAFLNGVTEAHTAWQNQDYADQPDYHGAELFNDHDKMIELLVEANKEGFSVHVHSEGGGAIHFMLNCIEDAEKITGNLDQRNVLAHLHFVTDEDIRRIGATNSIPAVPPFWTPNEKNVYEQEVRYVGKELADQSYPIKSFFDAGANVIFHSDYPVSPMLDIKYSIYTAETRNYPKGNGIRNIVWAQSNLASSPT